jgi:hypothetical protein
MRALKFTLPLLAALIFAGASFAEVTLKGVSSFPGQRATPEEAKTMAVRAAEHLKAQGPEKAFEVFSRKRGAPFHDRDLYVFVLHDSGELVAHGFLQERIGTNQLDLRDPDGKPFVREFLAISDEGWVEYKHESPMTHEIEEKTSYIVRVGEYAVGVGAYKY